MAGDEIYERLDPEEPLRDTEAQLRALVNSLPQLCWIANGDGYITWYNDRWYEYTGTTPEQMQGWGWQSVHDPAVLPMVLERWRASIESGIPFEMIFPLRGRDGCFRSFLTRIVPFRNASGKIVRWFGTNTDIDELRRTQDALRASEARLRLHQERLRLARSAAKVATWEYNAQSEQFEWSDEVFEMFKGMPIGPNLREFLSLLRYSADRDNAVRMFRNTAMRKREYEFVFRIASPGGKVRLFSARGTPFYNQGETIILGMFIEITPTQVNSARPRRSRPQSKARKQQKKRPPQEVIFRRRPHAFGPAASVIRPRNRSALI